MRKRWRWIVAAVVVLYVLTVSSTQDSAAGESGESGESLSCTMKVTADILNVRSGPGPGNPVMDRLAAGEVVSADRAVSSGFRQLGRNRWAAQLYLDPMPGSNCG